MIKKDEKMVLKPKKKKINGECWREYTMPITQDNKVEWVDIPIFLCKLLYKEEPKFYEKGNERIIVFKNRRILCRIKKNHI